MTKKEIILLKNGITNCTNLIGVKFAYAMAKNSDLIQHEIQALEQVIAESDDYKNLNIKRVELAEKFAKKDKDGKPLSEGGSYVMENMDLWKTAFEDFKKQDNNQSILEAREKQIKDYNALLEESVEINLFKVSIDDVPKDITTGQLIGIAPLIKD